MDPAPRDLVDYTRANIVNSDENIVVLVPHVYYVFQYERVGYIVINAARRWLWLQPRWLPRNISLFNNHREATSPKSPNQSPFLTIDLYVHFVFSSLDLRLANELISFDAVEFQRTWLTVNGGVINDGMSRKVVWWLMNHPQLGAILHVTLNPSIERKQTMPRTFQWSGMALEFATTWGGGDIREKDQRCISIHMTLLCMLFLTCPPPSSGPSGILNYSLWRGIFYV